MSFQSFQTHQVLTKLFFLIDVSEQIIMSVIDSILVKIISS